MILSIINPGEVRTQTVVERYGRIRVAGNRIVDQSGEPVALHGMSLFWSQWIGKYYNESCIAWLRDDWKCTVVRAAMAVTHGGYLTNPDAEMAKVRAVVDACIDLGIYVIVDWHDHSAENHVGEAVRFFRELAREYGHTPNLIYEIYNEPLQVSWSNVIKPYADTVIAAIREIDPDNLIIVGTPTWSQDVDAAALNPVDDANTAYALHFYAATHRQSLRNKAVTAMNRGIALFVSEFGTCESTGSGVLDGAETEKWFQFMDEHKLSWCNWSIADKVETAAALRPGADAAGGWSESDLTESGILVRDAIIARNGALFSSVGGRRLLNEAPAGFRIYPNPFNAETHFAFSLASPQPVRITLYDAAGRKTATVLDARMASGPHRLSLDLHGLPSGTYFYRCVTGDAVQTGRMQLVR